MNDAKTDETGGSARINRLINVLLPEREDKITLLCGGLLALAFFIAEHLAAVPWSAYFDDAHWAASYLTAAALGWNGVRRSVGVEKTVRRWCALGLWMYALGQLIWNLQSYFGWNPFPSPADIFFLMLPFGLIIGYIEAFRSIECKYPKRIALLDVATLAGVLAMATIVIYLNSRENVSALQFVALILYPIVFLTALSLVVLLALHARLRMTPPHIFLAVAMAANYALWLDRNMRVLDNTAPDGELINIIFSIMAIAPGLATRHWRMEATRSSNIRARQENILFYLPLIAIVVACGALIVAVIFKGTPGAARDIVIIGGGAIALFAAFRQSFLVDDLHKARKDVEFANNELKAYSESLEKTIVEREIAERKFKKIKEIIETTSGYVYTLANDRRVEYLNPAFRKTAGIAADADVSQFSDADFQPEETLQILREVAYPYISQHRVWSGETKMWNGYKTALIPVLQVIIPHFSEDGEFLGSSSIMHDLTEHRYAQQEIERRRRFFHGIFHGITHIGLMAFVVDSGGVFRLEGVNSWHSARGINIDEYLGKTLDELESEKLLSPEIAEDNRQRLRYALETGKEYAAEYKEGEDYLFKTVLPVPDEETGDVASIIITTANITKQKSLENFLRDIVRETSGVVGNKFFEVMVAYLAVVLKARYVLVGKLVDNNTMVETLAVCHDESIIGNFRYAVSAMPCQITLENKICAINEGAYRLYPGGPNLKDIGIESYVGALLISSDDKNKGILAVMHDQPLQDIEFAKWAILLLAARAAAEIDRLDAENALREEKEYISYILNTSPSMISSISVDGTLLFTNPASIQITGYAPEELIGRNWYDIFYSQEDRYAKQREFLAEIEKNNGVINDFPINIVSKTGEKRSITWNAVLVRDEDGNPTHISGVGSDITELLQARADEKRLEELKREKRSLELRSALQTIGQTDKGDLRLTILEIAKVAAKLLDADCVNYWEMDESSLRRLVCYSAKTEQPIPKLDDLTLLASDYPDYFAMMRKREDPLLISNARSHPLSDNLSDEYSLQSGSFSMIDSPVRSGDKTIGIFCVELRTRSGFAGEEIAFLSSTGNLIAYFIEAQERRKAAEELRRSEKRFVRAFLDNPLPMSIISVETGRFIDVNDVWTQSMGYSKEEVVGRAASEFGFDKSMDEQQYKFLRDASNSIESGRSLKSYEASARDKRGEDRDFLISMSNINMSGEACLLVAMQDITDRKRAENELRRRGEFLHRMIRSIPDEMIIVSLPDNRLFDANEAFLRNTGYALKDIVGKTFDEANIMTIADESMANAAEFYSRLFNEPFVSGGYIVWMISRDGSRRQVELSGVKVELDKDRECLCIFGRDVTERERVAEALRSAKSAAERINRAKSELLANMSHEIRTPMNAILGFTEILREQIQGARHRHFLDTINSSSKTLLALINDILDLSKIEAGKMDVEYTQTDIRRLLREIETMFWFRAQEKRIDFSVNISEETPNCLFLDEVRLRQTLFNLAGNAVKFTEYGGVEINVASTPSAKSGKDTDVGISHDMTIEVRDTGIGIPADQLTRIFEPFQQQEGQSVRKYGGTGLGLTITKRLTEMMGGAISVESIEGQGSVFKAYFANVRVCEHVSVQLEELFNASETIDMSGLNALVVDDAAANRELLTLHLSRFGANIFEAENGLEAISVAENCRPDIVFMDVRMPVMDGIEATELLRRQENMQDVPIVATTASAMYGDREKLDDIFDGYISKPFTRYELITEIRLVLGDALSSRAELFAASGPDKTADDDADRRAALANELAGSFAERCASLVKENRIKLIRGFADDLRAKADTYGVKAIARYAETLRAACDSYDVKNIKLILSQFADIVEKFR